MKYRRLDDMERRAAALQADAQQLATVSFADGTRRKMRLADVVPLMMQGENHVTAFEGEGGAGNGQLAALLRGLMSNPDGSD